MKPMRVAIIVAMALATGGCVRTIADVVTAPVKIVSKTADVLTTSQSEADERRGRELRQREERLGKLERKRSKLAQRCRDDDEGCDELDAVDDQIRAEMDRPN
jgi:uncharacterized protein YlxW (UPF0749 family)